MKIDEAKRCVGPGWSKLLEEFFIRRDPGVQVFGVKEKYGALRIECTPSTDLEEEFEERSTTICEECGQPGELRDLNWIRTLCDEHYASRKFLGGSIS